MSQPERTPDVEGDETTGLAIAAGGGVGLLFGLVFGSRVLRILGLLGIVAGACLYAREKLAARQAEIDEAETAIRAELDDLDPVARAQVLADLARSQL